MKAATFSRYGSPSELTIVDLPKPTPSDNQVLVKIHAACINDWDYGLLTGTPFVNRTICGLTQPKPNFVMGSDIAGVVEAVGKNITRFKVGDEVYGDLSDKNGWGGYAEYVCATQDALCRKPSAMSMEQAAAIPQVAVLALQGLIDYGEIRKGQTLLINGAGGGVGTLAVQIAKTFDCEVTGVDNAHKLQMMLDLGFDHVIDYQQQDFTRNGKQYDIVLDNKASRSVFSLARSLKPGGVYVTTGGNLWYVLQAVLLAGLVKLLYKKRIKMVMLKPNKDLEYINSLFEKGSLKPVIDCVYPLDNIREAFDRYASGKQGGKIVISM